MDESSPVRFSRVGDVLWIRIEGKGTFRNSGGLKRYCNHLIAEGDAPKAFVIDLDECPVMDSTFMGVLTGLALTLGSDIAVEVINANTRNRQLLHNLGLDHILTVIDDSEFREEERKLVAAGVAMERVSETLGREEQAEHILEAHRALGSANPENIPRFKDVVKFFEGDLDKLRGGGDGGENGASEDEGA